MLGKNVNVLLEIGNSAFIKKNYFILSDGKKLFLNAV